MPMENGKKHHRKALQRHSTGEAEKYYQTRRLVTGFKHIRLLHGNVPALASEIVTALWKKEKVTVLPHLSYSLDLALCDFFMFAKLKKFLAGRMPHAKLLTEHHLEFLCLTRGCTGSSESTLV